ncbi:MAG: hypothetical protein AB7H90_18430 [Alphaproteobacteria bacterium]
MSRIAAALAIGLALLLCGCSMREPGNDRRDGFYAGVSGGLSRP